MNDLKKIADKYNQVIILAIGIVLLVLLRDVVQETISRLIFLYFFTALAFRIDSRIPIVAALLLLLGAALAITRSETYANTLAINAYFFLVVGVLLALFEYMRKKKTGEEEGEGEERITSVEKVYKGGENRPRIIAVASGKGGVGKTTIAANLGTALAEIGYMVTLIDMDLAMPNLEIITGLRNPPVGLVDVLDGKLELDRVVYSGPMGTQVIPPGILLDGYSNENVEKIKKLLLDFPLKSDFVILDMPPGREAVNVLHDGIEAILVVNPNKPALLDALNMKVLLEKKGVKMLGAVLNRVHRADEEWIDNTERILEMHVVAVIPESRIVIESLHNEECFVATAGQSAPSKEIMELAKELTSLKTPP